MSEVGRMKLGSRDPEERGGGSKIGNRFPI